MRRTRYRRRSTRCYWSTSSATPPDRSDSGAGGVEGGDRVTIEAHASGGQQRPQLIEAGIAGNRRGHALFFGCRLDRRENAEAARVQIFAEALVGFRGDGAHHLTRAAIRAPSRA